MAVALAGSDVDGDTLIYSVQADPTGGTLSGTAPDLTYTPGADFNGADQFTYLVNDGTEDSLLATVDIFVDPVNDAPVADSLSVFTAEDSALPITLTGSDPEGTALNFTIVQASRARDR